MNEELFVKHISELQDHGFTILHPVYSQEETEQLISLIDQADQAHDTFRKSAQVFAIRQFLKEIPEVIPVIFNDALRAIVSGFFGKDYFCVKSIYFDKPADSNWFVPYHQDLTISVDQKMEVPGYGPWTTKQDQYAVQPPLNILQNMFTIRIHLDDTNKYNGALKVIPGSHLKNIYRPETIELNSETEQICCVKKGGIMIMKPLLMHASNRTTSASKRRVIHIEFSNLPLSEELNWAEKFVL